MRSWGGVGSHHGGCQPRDMSDRAQYGTAARTCPSLALLPTIMHPLAAHTVSVVLQHISPLTDPLPPHLISTPLRQRHHFLRISPSSPVEYLCWPSPDNTKTIGLLDRLPLLSDQASYSTRYTSDPESIFAHAQVLSGADGLRMLFHWDDIHGWRYHDLRLMPFPSSSFSTPQESLASNSACGAGPPRPLSLDLIAEADRISSDGDDSYWDAYGATGHDLTSHSPSRSDSQSDVAEGEDAYWAQYASVQGCYFRFNASCKNFQLNSSPFLGSADSTLPSPLRTNRKLPVNCHESAFPPSAQDDLIIDVPVDTIHSRPLAPRLGPPSPDMLAHLLTTISPRKDVHASIIDDPHSSQSPSAYSTDPSPEQTIADSELVTPPLPNGYLDGVVSPDVVEINKVPLSKCRPHPLGEAEDKALTDSIRGLYYLWKAGRKEPDEKDRSVFLRIVQAAIAYE